MKSAHPAIIFGFYYRCCNKYICWVTFKFNYFIITLPNFIIWEERRQKMKKKIVAIFLVGMFILTGITSVTVLSAKENISKNQIDDENPEYRISFLDQVDQQQTEFDLGKALIPISLGGAYLAQSFTPTLGKLTKIKLFISSRNHNFAHDIFMAIFHYLPASGDLWDPITIVQRPMGNQVPIYPAGEWYEFDFPDLYVSTGSLYYIVCYVYGGNLDNFYYWGGKSNNPYPNGQHLFCADPENWYWIKSTSDLCFKTYGESASNHQPSIPSIQGPNSGRPGIEYTYTFRSTDGDDDKIKYYIDWGDGDTEWTDYYRAGKYLQKSHKWDEKGSYTISVKAKDIRGKESYWNNLIVTMPRYKAINNPFLSFLQNHPNMFPLLQMLFQRLGLL